jgi:hypothetical protein
MGEAAAGRTAVYEWTVLNQWSDMVVLKTVAVISLYYYHGVFSQELDLICCYTLVGTN